MLASNLIDSLVTPSRVHPLQFSCQPGTIHHDCLIVGKIYSPVMFSHEQRVKNNQIQLFVDPEVASKEAILKFTEMILLLLLLLLLLLSYFFKNHFTGPIGPMVGKYNLIIDDSFFFYLFPAAANVAAGHFSRRFPRAGRQRALPTSLARLLGGTRLIGI